MTGPPSPPGGRFPATAGRQDRRRRVVGQILWYAGLVTLSVVFVAPLVWMLVTSVKTEQDATDLPQRLLPDPFTTGAYDLILRATSDTPVLRWFLNSMLAAGGHALLVLAVAAPAAYALARMSFPGKRAIFGVVIATLFIPGFVFLIPNYLIVDRLGWLDSLWALIVPGAAGAFGVFFLRQFFVSLPGELEEAALIDGANRWQIFTMVALPLARPALATLAVLSFLANWNDFLWPLYVMFTPERLTLPPGLATLQGAYTTNYPVLMAGGVLASVPVLLLFVVAQRYIVEGVARTGLKG
jgi:multiple sugar transport system permease protein